MSCAKMISCWTKIHINLISNLKTCRDRLSSARYFTLLFENIKNLAHLNQNLVWFIQASVNTISLTCRQKHPPESVWARWPLCGSSQTPVCFDCSMKAIQSWINPIWGNKLNMLCILGCGQHFSVNLSC